MSLTLDQTRFDQRVADAVLRRLCEDVSTVIDRSFQVRDVTTSRVNKRAVGEGLIHISFKLEMRQGDRHGHGALLLPLPEAIALACFLMMVPDESVAQHRKQKDLDRTLKDAMLEIGNFVGGAGEAALRQLLPGESIKLRSKGCQGVRPGVRPAFPYVEGDPLLLAKAKGQVAEFKDFDLLLMLPPIEPPAEG